MFSRLRKKLFNSIFLVVLAFVLVTGAISYVTILAYMYNTQQQRTVKNVQSGVVGCQNYFETVMAFVSSTCNNREVAETLQSGGSSTIAGLLDDLCNNYVEIDGVILYGLDGYVSYSSGMGSVPRFSDLVAVEEIAVFVDSAEKSLISVRRNAVSQVYNKNFYDVRQGIASCFCKVFDENGALLGLLEADILPQTLYSAKLSFNSFGAMSQAFFVKQGEILTTDDQYASYNIAKGGFDADFRYFVTSVKFDENTQIVMFVPLANFVKRATLLFFVFFAVQVVLICAGIIVAHFVSESVVSPLERLLKKMEAVGHNLEAAQ